MNYVRTWDWESAPVLCADGSRLGEGVREVWRGGEAYAVRAVLGTSPRLHGEYRPVIYCTAPDGRAVRLSPKDVTAAPPDGAGERRG